MRTTTAAIALLVLGPAVAGCGANTTLKTTPTFKAARVLPTPAPKTIPARVPYSPTKAPRHALAGGTWVIDNIAPGKMYDFPTRVGQASFIILSEGISINDGVLGGDVNGFTVVGTHVGQKAAVMVTPNYPGRRTNIAIPTTNDFLYHFMVTSSACGPWVLQVEVNHAAPIKPPVFGLAPAGQYQRLSVTPVADKPVPAWAPVEVWADGGKMVARFAEPLPTLPGLYAGQEGEQTVNYSVERIPGYVILSTDRRVTEGEFRLGDEVLRISATPQPREWKPIVGRLEPRQDGASLATATAAAFDERGTWAVGVAGPGVEPPRVLDAGAPKSPAIPQPTI